MKEKKIFTITDLGGGDGGKGGVVHGVCVFKNAHTVLKVGGAQGSHGVRTSRGESFNFSQFGCGTFEGVKTYVTSLMVVDPISLLVEGNSLCYERGVPNAFDLLTLDENCLCTIPFYGIASRLRELSRKNQKGTVGVGVGEAKFDSERYPELAIYARDIGKSDIRDRVEAVRVQKLAELGPIIKNIASLWPDDHGIAKEELAFLNNPNFVDWIVEQLRRFQSQVKIVGSDYLKKEILSKDGVAVVESSHGILTDKYHGFHPFTSRLRTVPSGILDLLKGEGYDGEIVKLGVTRAYQIRHGAGPLVTEDPEMVDSLLPGSSKNENRWQGKVRVGPLDFVALRYAIEVCGGPAAFDGIAVTWFDQIQKIGTWKICDKYIGADDLNYFSPSGEILVRRGTDESQIKHQEVLGKQLFQCQPCVASLESSGDLCAGVLKEKLNIPVRMISYGSTENDKVCL